MFRIILHVLILFIFYYIGTGIQALFDLFIPGSIIGMLLLFLFLSMGWLRAEWIDLGAALLVKHLPLLFLPVIVGIINYFELFAGKGVLLLVVVFVSTMVVMLSSGFLTNWLWQRGGQHDD